jgi:hypothetical protein
MKTRKKTILKLEKLNPDITGIIKAEQLKGWKFIEKKLTYNRRLSEMFVEMKFEKKKVKLKIWQLILIIIGAISVGAFGLYYLVVYVILKWSGF